VCSTSRVQFIMRRTATSFQCGLSVDSQTCIHIDSWLLATSPTAAAAAAAGSASHSYSLDSSLHTAAAVATYTLDT